MDDVIKRIEELEEEMIIIKESSFLYNYNFQQPLVFPRAKSGTKMKACLFLIYSSISLLFFGAYLYIFPFLKGLYVVSYRSRQPDQNKLSFLDWL